MSRSSWDAGTGITCSAARGICTASNVLHSSWSTRSTPTLFSQFLRVRPPNPRRVVKRFLVNLSKNVRRITRPSSPYNILTVVEVFGVVPDLYVAAYSGKLNCALIGPPYYCIVYSQPGITVKNRQSDASLSIVVATDAPILCVAFRRAASAAAAAAARAAVSGRLRGTLGRVLARTDWVWRRRECGERGSRGRSGVDAVRGRRRELWVLCSTARFTTTGAMRRCFSLELQTLTVLRLFKSVAVVNVVRIAVVVVLLLLLLVCFMKRRTFPFCSAPPFPYASR